jgi:hypothetical protein
LCSGSKSLERRYFEGERQLTIPSEMLTGRIELLASMYVIDAIIHREIIEPGKKEQITGNICSSGFFDVTHEFN